VVDGRRFILSSGAVDQQALDHPVVGRTQPLLDGCDERARIDGGAATLHLVRHGVT
jgi:hypothetical protein